MPSYAHLSAGTLTGLSPGTFLALTKEQLKALRSCKGDRKRREHVETLACARLDVADTWQFLSTIGGWELCVGKSLHRGEMHWIMLLDVAAARAVVAKLGELDLRAAFFAIDEAMFRHRNVPFWVTEKWELEGRTTVLDDAVFANVERRLTKFIATAAADARHVLFTMSALLIVPSVTQLV